MHQSGEQQRQLVGSIYNSSLLDLSYVNCTTGDQQFIINPKQEDSDVAIKGAALGTLGLLDFATKEENESCGSIASSNGQDREEDAAPADIDDSWLSDLMVMNTSINNNMDKQVIVDNGGSIFTPSCHDNMAATEASLLDKYLAQQNFQQQQQQLQTAPIMDNEEFDTYFNELFPDLAI